MSLIEDSVCADIQTRAALGLQKYGVTLERTDIDHRGWLQHAYEEALDLACYLKRAMTELEKTLKNQEPKPEIPVTVMCKPDQTFYPIGEIIKISAEMQSKEGLSVAFAKVEATEGGGCGKCILFTLGHCTEYFPCQAKDRADNLHVKLIKLEKPE